MDTLFTYSLNTVPSPLTAGLADGTITLMGTNNTGAPVTIGGILICIPTGTQAGCLTNAPKQIKVSLPEGWTQHTPNVEPGKYTMVLVPPGQTPNPAVTVAAGDALVFTLSNILLNSSPGTAVLEITQGSTGQPTLNLPVSVFPIGWGSVDFAITPANLTQPGNVTLTWSGPDGAAYSFTYFDAAQNRLVVVPQPGSSPLSNTGIYPGQGDPQLILNKDTTFTLNVTELIDLQTYSIQQQQTVTVDTPEILTLAFTLSDDTITEAAPAININWQTQLADGCSLSIGGCTGTVEIGAANETINQCTLTCSAAGVIAVTDSTGKLLGQITLPQPFPASVTLTITASNSTTRAITQQSAAINLVVPIQIVQFAASDVSGWPTFVPIYCNFTLTWQVEHASTVSFSFLQDAVAASGSQSFREAMIEAASVTITANGFLGPVTQTIDIVALIDNLTNNI